jgi:hypothetical protein
MQLSTPSEGAKSALFARIAQTPTVSAPVVAIAAPQYSAIVDSPASKRGPARDQQKSATSADSGSTNPSPAWLNGRVAKFAAAPLALALVLVSIYVINPFDRNNVPAGGDVASLVETPLVSSDANSEPTKTINQSAPGVAPTVPSNIVQVAKNATQDDSSIDTAVNLDGFTTQFLSSQPLYALSARSNGGPTESARSIAPTEGLCRMSSYEEGQYQLSLIGVSLPGGAGEAAIYLKAKNGETTQIGTITIDQNGNGQTTLSLEQSITDYSMLMIGPGEGGANTAKPLNGSMTFSLTSADQLSTFEAAST